MRGIDDRQDGMFSYVSLDARVPVRQWVVTFPHTLRFLFATRPAVMGRVLDIVYRTQATYQRCQAG